METGRYLRVFCGVILGGLVLAGLINLAVDPYSTFRWSDIQGFNDQKHLKRGGGRVNKSVILSRYPFDILFFGTSRAELGLDPNSPALEGATAFNAAQAGTSMTEIRLEALFAAEKQTPKTVIIDLDFLTFTPTDDLSGTADFPESPYAGRSLVPIMVQRLISWPSLLDCVMVFRNSVRHRPAVFTKFGNFDRSAVKSDITRREAFTKVAQDFLQPTKGYRGFIYNSERMSLLADVVARYRAQGVQVLLFVSPLHARQLEIMWEVGLFPDFERWKRDLVAMLAQNSNGADVQLWDFSGYNSITSEAVSEQMRWYWESSHYTKEAGDLVLDRMLRHPHGGGAGPDDFGIRLTPATIEHSLATIRHGHNGYGRAFPAEVEDVRRLVRQTVSH